MRPDRTTGDPRPGQLEEDPRLLAAARLGDERAYGRLVEHHRPGLERFCELMLGCPVKAHDAVQEALLRGWRSLDCSAQPTSARIWLYRLATCVCMEDLDATDEVRRHRPLNPPKEQ
jgi:RNA polymerase sigma-70 factor (ECF subfamily)